MAVSELRLSLVSYEDTLPETVIMKLIPSYGKERKVLCWFM